MSTIIEDANRILKPFNMKAGKVGDGIVALFTNDYEYYITDIKPGKISRMFMFASLQHFAETISLLTTILQRCE